MDHSPDLSRLPRLWYASIVLGLAATVAGLFWSGLPGRVEWLWIIMSVAVGTAVFGGCFFIGANLAGAPFEGRLKDETKIRGSNVDHITHIEKFDQAETDRWLDRYVAARNLFGALIVPLVIFAVLFLVTG